ncbi:ROK family protein [Xanthocytophaga agilis]|uniref:ROK family protein n=1 Tax=Xanthocytophaga agilis TaxID=3048010 RepID=A0AAE3QYV2_9BACT|nr:ROK family protein [Xanthocytophaga agilis]MDJ1500564.1 ROK family protein [Xanthocytophaga agilis]
MEIFTGIDIGGSSVKFGLVESDGKLLEKKKVPVKELRASGVLSENILASIQEWIKDHPQVKEIGIGVPGMISRDRRSLVELANMPELNGLPIVELLEKANPGIAFYLENDANAAALGEYYFSGQQLPENFLLVTLGTGVGSGLIIDHKIFKGADGNGLELGHIVAGNGKSIEQNIGKVGFYAKAAELLKEHKGKSVLRDVAKIDDDVLLEAARDDDPVALKAFAYYGKYVGEALATAAYILDVKTFIIGGGVAKGYPFMQEQVLKSMQKFLTPYYLDKLDIRLAVLRNNAGILGAAALCFK